MQHNYCSNDRILYVESIPYTTTITTTTTDSSEQEWDRQQPLSRNTGGQITAGDTSRSFPVRLMTSSHEEGTDVIECFNICSLPFIVQYVYVNQLLRRDG